MSTYFISAVSYSSSNEKHIEFVRVHSRDKKEIGSGDVIPRGFVIKMIQNENAKFRTWPGYYHGSRDEHFIEYLEDEHVGSEVHVRSGRYLSTDPNETEEDNLSSLTAFKYEVKE